MSLLRWKDEYLTQVEEIDTQHQRLMDLVNEIHDQMRFGRGPEAISEALGELVRYTKFHFASEEKLMGAAAYDQSEAHAAEHHRLLEQILELRHSIQDGHVEVTMDDMHFLKDWLLTHFQGPDKMLAMHLLANQAAP